MTLGDLFAKSAQMYPGHTACIHGKNRSTYASLNAYASVLMNYLMNRGIRKGDRILLFLDNSIAYIASMFGVMNAGAIAVPLNTQLVSRELHERIEDSDPSFIITEKRFLPEAHSAVSLHKRAIPIIDIADVSSADRMQNDCGSGGPVLCSDDDCALIIYTSGTMGKPKGVMLSHRNLCANAESIVSYLELTPQDSVIVVMPFCYAYGMSLITTHIRAGGTLIIDNRFMYPNTVLETLVQEQATGFAGVPSHFAILLKKSSIRKFKFPRMRYVTQAGGYMPPELIKEFISLFPDVRFYVMYGQTEATARLTYLSPGELQRKPGSAGKAIPGVTLTIRRKDGSVLPDGETGEITAEGNNIMMGYWNDADETRRVIKDNRLYTGDLGYVDAEGFLYIAGREKLMIKSGAHRISPYEIEEVVSWYPGVTENAAIGIPDDILGEAIMLFVAGSGLTETDKEKIFIHCRKHLGQYQIPKYITIVKALPKTAAGKIDIEALKNAIK